MCSSDLLSSDDGSSLQIGGTSIISNDGIHALGGSTASVIFNSTGVYSIFAEYFENSGQTGFTLQMDGTQIATSSLYSAQVLPEPGTLGLFAVGLLGLHKARRWRRTACR